MFRRIARAMAPARALAPALALLLLLAVAVACGPTPGPGVRGPDLASCEVAAVVHATLYPRPHAPPVTDATIELRRGVIRAVGPGAATATTATAACVIDARGRVVVSGFWNAHVHFTDPRFRDLGDAARLIHDMLLRRGFTSAVDTGADPRVLYPLREAITAGAIPGPRIIAAEGSLVYRNGTPAYLPRGLLPEVTTPAEAERAVNTALDQGADGIKIFSGSFQTRTYTIYLPPDVIAAVTRAAHARGAFVVSHPTDLRGLVNAVDNGVDVLAHTAPPAGALSPELIARMRRAGVALTPTLKLWRWDLERAGIARAEVEAFTARAVAQLRGFHRAGGEVLFGTDAGFMTDFDTREEFALMARAGMDFHDILASLTTNPARRFTDTDGVVAPGEPADLVILGGEPTAARDAARAAARTEAAPDPTALADVDVVIRAGRVLYRR